MSQKSEIYSRYNQPKASLSCISVVFAVTEIGSEAAAGDFFTALELGNALERRFGWRVEFRPAMHDWFDLSGIDILIVMVDEYDLSAIKNASSTLLKIAWARNWFDRWVTRPWAAEYDLYLASSRESTTYISDRLGRLARLFPIATNPVNFNCAGRLEHPALDWVFTGSYWGHRRDVMTSLMAVPHRFRGAIFGRHWSKVPQLAEYSRGFVPYCDLPGVYRQASIVIDDANHATKSWGAANSRVFDALASGCLVITNSQRVSAELFNGRLPFYESPASLANQLDHYLSNHAEREKLIHELRNIVLAKHCYSHRAFELGLHLQSIDRSRIGFASSTSSRQNQTSLLSHRSFEQHRPLRPLQSWPFISFVVPLFNHLAETKVMLRSLQHSLPPNLEYEIILADDSSTDGTIEWLNSLEDSRIKISFSSSNRGYAATNNAGVLLARGEILCFINNDLIFAPGWIEPMLATLQSGNLNAGIVGNLQYRVCDNQLDHAGVKVDLRGRLDHAREFPQNQEKIIETFAITGACCLMRADDFRAVGGFNDAYRNGVEDIDLCMEIKRLGKKCYVAKESRVQHHVSLSRDRGSLRNEINSRYFFLKWRKEIKTELASHWRPILRSRSIDPHQEIIDGQLNASLPDAGDHSTSLLLAENLLKRHDHRWIRDIDQEDPNANLRSKYSLSGLTQFNSRYAIFQNGIGHVICNPLQSTRNFYVCGYRCAGAETPGVELVIDVNGIQFKRFPLEQEQSINFGIREPLILPGITNVFEIRIERDGNIVTDRSLLEKIAITHFVIDDHHIPLPI